MKLRRQLYKIPNSSKEADSLKSNQENKEKRQTSTEKSFTLFFRSNDRFCKWKMARTKCLYSFVESFNKVTFSLVRLMEDVLKCFPAVTCNQVCYIIWFFYLMLKLVKIEVKLKTYHIQLSAI